MRKLITLFQKTQWIKYVKRSVEYDFYHTWHYHTLDQSGDPFLFVYEEGDNYIALPLLKRKISDSPFSDLASVYGYTGPISNRKFEDLEESLMDNFKSSFLDFLDEEQNISVFSRLHPFFNQYLLIEKFGGVYKNGKTVAIDLTISIDQQRKKYRKSTYQYIKKAWSNGYSVKETKDLEDINVFFNIYTENMTRIKAEDYYFFNQQYFIDLINTDEFDCRLVLVYAGDKIICGSVITCTCGIIEAHLVATLTKYLYKSPAKFLTDEISILGRKLGMKYYHLGGGLGFKEDSLFNWKAGFSDLFLEYKSWRYVANEGIYNSLVNRIGINPNNNIDYFPLYRFGVVPVNSDKYPNLVPI
ncbi:MULTISPECIES: GNAT family N-acetyltransferase [Sphingobacterium]|uniref:GNAT family N-acetyltransferase n=1 Tax=Sphingobacterium TaxID=28453 RepID=UPI0013DB853E|nr:MULTISPECIES: GNAT family N-acetyltransferase [unclassified Sphingobacterium]